MNKLYECRKCGVVTEAPDQICSPEVRKEIQDYCGSASERDAMCSSVKDHLSYVCSTCGRAAEQPDLVCHPLVIDE